jgi:hypothetical protein
MSVKAAREALGTALGTVAGVRVYKVPTATVDPPAVVLSLPDLHWEAYCDTPTRATFEIAVIAKLNDRAIEVLEELVLDVHAALEGVDGASAELARVGTWDDALPAYLIETEMSL